MDSFIAALESLADQLSTLEKQLSKLIHQDEETAKKLEQIANHICPEKRRTLNELKDTHYDSY